MSRVRLISAGLLAVASVLAGGVGVAWAVENPNDGVGLQVRVTASPAPVVDSPPAVPTGVSVTEARFPIALRGLEPFSYVEIFANSTPVLIASGFADANGEFTTTVALPANLAPGDHSITATITSSSGAKTSLTIVTFAVTANGKLAAAGASSRGPASSSGRGANSAGSDGVTSEPVAEEEAEAALGSDPFQVGGSLWFGGFNARADYASGIFEPGISVNIVVRNVADEPVTARAALRLSSIGGVEIAERSDLKLATLEPGETRRVTVTVPKVGSWGFYDVVLDVKLPGSDASVMRTASAFVIPLPALFILFGVLLIAIIAAWTLSKLGVSLRRRSAPEANWSALEEVKA